MAEASVPSAAPRRLMQFGFALFMLALTILFVALGIWQVQRLGEKEAQLAAIAGREALAPVPLPPAAQWGELDPQSYDYRPVALKGRYRADQSVLVFTSLGQAKGQYSGSGFWVMTPLVLDDGGTVFVNRGFVPQDRGPAFLETAAVPSENVEVTGLARVPEPGNSFTPDSDPVARLAYVRNIDRLQALVDPVMAPFAPLYVDAPAGAPGTLPQGGETVLTITNRHFEYALTWFSLALITPLLLGFWLWRNRQAGA